MGEGGGGTCEINSTWQFWQFIHIKRSAVDKQSIADVQNTWKDIIESKNINSAKALLEQVSETALHKDLDHDIKNKDQML